MENECAGGKEIITLISNQAMLMSKTVIEPQVGYPFVHETGQL